MGNSSKNKKYAPYLEGLLVLGLITGLFVFFIQFDWVNDLKPATRIDKISAIIGVFLMMYLVLLVHELGHLLVGLAQGFRFELLVVGFLGIKRECNRIKPYLNTLGQRCSIDFSSRRYRNNTIAPNNSTYIQLLWIRSRV